MEDDLNLFSNEKQSHFFFNWKMTSIYFLMVNDFNFLLSNGRGPQFCFSTWRQPQSIFVLLLNNSGRNSLKVRPSNLASQPSLSWAWHSSAPACLSSLFLSALLTFLPEGVIVGFWNFAWGFKSQKNHFGREKLWGTHPAPRGSMFWFFFEKKNCA